MEILALLYAMLPAYLANMAPVFCKRLNILNYPLDAGRTFRGKQILGSHKTLRGIMVALLAGMLIFWLQQALYGIPFFQNLSWIAYPEHSVFIGMLLAAGAMLGDLIKSFFKRQRNILPGQRWFPWDQVDFMLGALLVGSYIFPFQLTDALILLGITLVLHIAANHIGYYLGLNQQKW